jgi:hypothetical protein
MLNLAGACTKPRDFKAGVFSLYLLKGHILMAERFAGRNHVLQSKVCVLLQDMPTDISLHKHNRIVLLFYLFMHGLTFIIIYLYPPPCKLSLLSSCSIYCDINPLKTRRICFIKGLSAYRAVNTLHFGYKNQSVNVL